MGQLEILGGLRVASNVRGQFQLSAYNDDIKIQNAFKVKKGPENYSFLVWRESEEEVVLDIQGLIAACTLPPITKRTKYVTSISYHLYIACNSYPARFSPQKAHLLKQSVTLVGHDSAHFRASISALKKLYQYIEQNFAVGLVRPLQVTNPVPDMESEAIQAATRIMTPFESKVWPLALASLTPTIDPDGILREVVNSGKHQFTEDNVVIYSEMVSTDDGYALLFMNKQ